MEKTKNSRITLVFVIILVLLLGIGIGYYITTNIYKGQIIKETSNVETPIKQTQIKYDGSQNIKINNTNYKISYLSDIFDEETEIKLYLNDKKIKTLNMGWIENIDHIYGEKDYKVELHEFCKDYILIVVKAQKADGEFQAVNYVQFCIINTEGEHIGTLKWDDATEIYIKETFEQLKYEINKDYLIIEDSATWKYFVTRDYMDRDLIKVYREDDLIFAGA